MEGFKMSINVELIDELRKRANVSYEDAKEALEKNNGDLVEALIYLEKQNKVKTECGSSFVSSVKKIVKKGNRIKFIIKKQESTILSLPLTAAVIITIVAPYVTVIGLIVAIFTGHRIKFQGENGKDMKINKTVDKVTDIVGDLTKD
jgi:ATP-dependent Zn protease